MAAPLYIQSAQGECVIVPGVGVMMVVRTADPVGGEVGFGPGALWLAFGSGKTWQNTGSETDAAWTALGAGGVTSFDTRTGDVTLTDVDVTAAVGQELATTGTPTFAGLTVSTATAFTVGQFGVSSVCFSMTSGTPTFQVNDTTNNNISTSFVLQHNLTSGSPLAGIGTNFQLAAPTTVAGKVMFVIQASWTTIGASQTGDRSLVQFFTVGFHGTEFMRAQQIGTAQTAIGFFGATAVAKQTAGAVTAGYTAGVSTAVTIDGTFTGNVGSTAYTIADIVAALKNYGLLTS